MIPDAPQPQWEPPEVTDSFREIADGWEYGPVKDPEAKEHPCLVPFSDLPREQQAKDFLFRAVVRALA